MFLVEIHYQITTCKLLKIFWLRYTIKLQLLFILGTNVIGCLPLMLLSKHTMSSYQMQSDNEDNISMHSSKNKNHIKCKIFNWTGKDEIVAEGRWVSNDSKMLVNDVPLGPKTMIVWVDVPTSPEAFLWRPTPDMTSIEDAKVAWPADKVVLENISINNMESPNITSPLVIFFVDTIIILIFDCTSFFSIIDITVFVLLLECEQLKGKVQLVRYWWRGKDSY
ncbi:uncharacterized protein LOC109837182 isoform X2 [Asparagus officinalis]|uniref:uncharacterized protein LOC109837182 isoform X2 n=1 Tax=Asparagus officinalis TaxID=4686 RepID=UPI00098DFE29|nr:uncharacterized protein LOC109837182 isoform X2 [Asparagus officinalis]